MELETNFCWTKDRVVAPNTLLRNILCNLEVFFKLVNIYIVFAWEPEQIENDISQSICLEAFCEKDVLSISDRFKTLHKTCLKIEKTWFLQVNWVLKNSRLILLCYFHIKIIPREHVISINVNSWFLATRTTRSVFTYHIYIFFSLNIMN